MIHELEPTQKNINFFRDETNPAENRVGARIAVGTNEAETLIYALEIKAANIERERLINGDTEQEPTVDETLEADRTIKKIQGLTTYLRGRDPFVPSATLKAFSESLGSNALSQEDNEPRLFEDKQGVKCAVLQPDDFEFVEGCLDDAFIEISGETGTGTNRADLDVRAMDMREILDRLKDFKDYEA